jgi:hypothetical protein
MHVEPAFLLSLPRKYEFECSLSKCNAPYDRKLRFSRAESIIGKSIEVIRKPVEFLLECDHLAAKTPSCLVCTL